MIGSYPFNGNNEYCLKIDKNRTKKVLIIAPLFEEANRVRHTLVETMRALDALGVDSFLPDLPGRNESAMPSDAVDLNVWQAALNACASHSGNIPYIASLRGGSLLDHVIGAQAVWRLSPVKGAQILRAMVRTRIASERENGNEVNSKAIMEIAKTDGIALAGNWMSANMVAQLEPAIPPSALPCREVKISSAIDSGADIIQGSPLWLRAEPDHDAQMAKAMADDIAEWIG